MSADDILFNPEKGDLVEFRSDLQTEKGPSSGTVTFVDRNSVCIGHSDGYEWFDADRVKVLSIGISQRNGCAFWKLK